MKFSVTLLLIALSTNSFSADKHYEQARKHVLLTVKFMNIPELAENTTNGLLMQQPQFRPFKDVFVTFFTEILSSEEYKEAQTQLYMQHFTAEELEYANHVYSDPKLNSYLMKTPTILQDSLILGQKIGQKHKNRLKSALEARASEIEELTKGRSNE